VIDGAKSMAMTALDLIFDPHKMTAAKADFEATSDLSRAAIARSREPMKHGHDHAQGCGCAR
jgi:hypothetical protein